MNEIEQIQAMFNALVDAMRPLLDAYANAWQQIVAACEAIQQTETEQK
jgi:hypothetical protein